MVAAIAGKEAGKPKSKRSYRYSDRADLHTMRAVHAGGRIQYRADYKPPTVVIEVIPDPTDIHKIGCPCADCFQTVHRRLFRLALYNRNSAVQPDEWLADCAADAITLVNYGLPDQIKSLADRAAEHHVGLREARDAARVYLHTIGLTPEAVRRAQEDAETIRKMTSGAAMPPGVSATTIIDAMGYAGEWTEPIEADVDVEDAVLVAASIAFRHASIVGLSSTEIDRLFSNLESYLACYAEVVGIDILA